MDRFKDFLGNIKNRKFIVWGVSITLLSVMILVLPHDKFIAYSAAVGSLDALYFGVNAAVKKWATPNENKSFPSV